MDMCDKEFLKIAVFPANTKVGPEGLCRILPVFQAGAYLHFLNPDGNIQINVLRYEGGLA